MTMDLYFVQIHVTNKFPHLSHVKLLWEFLQFIWYVWNQFCHDVTFWLLDFAPGNTFSITKLHVYYLIKYFNTTTYIHKVLVLILNLCLSLFLYSYLLSFLLTRKSSLTSCQQHLLTSDIFSNSLKFHLQNKSNFCKLMGVILNSILFYSSISFTNT